MSEATTRRQVEETKWEPRMSEATTRRQVEELDP
jgi:hypothetical protein